MKVFDAAANVLRTPAKERPALIVFEDLHNAGPATLAMVEYLKEACAESPILIVAVTRSSDAVSAADIGRLRRPVRGAKPLVISLGPISSEAAVAIVKDSKLVAARDAHVQRPVSTAAGHPLFLTELLNARVETGRSDTPISARLHDVIAERLTSRRRRAFYSKPRPLPSWRCKDRTFSSRRETAAVS